MKTWQWILLGVGAYYLFFRKPKALPGVNMPTAQRCGRPDADKHLQTIAGIYGMLRQHVGCRVPDRAGAQGGVEIYDTRNGAGMIWAADGDLSYAATMATEAVAQSAGNQTFATKPYDGALFIAS